MSGHSKWSSIKHKKAAADSKRGKIFTKSIKEITVAAREGGGDVSANPRLRTAILVAKSVNMPAENIDRAIKKGTGELPGVNYEAITYEGFGPAGVALLVEVLTDNKNRTHPELRKVFEKRGGNLGSPGCVAWMFTKKGMVVVQKETITEDKLLEIVLDAGAQDVDASSDEVFIVYADVLQFEQVKEALEAANVKIDSSQLAMIANDDIKVEGKVAQQVLALVEELEDHDDVQNVYANVDIAD